MTRFTIHGTMSKILIEIWHSLSCIYSCLISYCSNQRSLASSVLDFQTRLVRSTSFLSGSVLLLSLPLLSHQCRSSVSSRIWALHFPSLIQYVWSLPILLMMLPLNARSINVSPMSLSLNLAALLKLVPRNRAIVASTTAKLC